MEIQYINNMRIERNNIRMGLAGARSNWEKHQLTQRKKFDIPHIYYGERNPLVEYINQWTICIRIEIDSKFPPLLLIPFDRHSIPHQKI